MIAEAVSDLLRDAGYVTFVAPTCEAASASLAAIRPDCVVLDCSLPDGTADEVLHNALSAGHAPPTVLLSASPTAKQVASRFGVMLVNKPYEPDMLLAAVESALEHEISPQSAREARLQRPDVPS